MIWGAHASGVLAIAFCDRGLSDYSYTSLYARSQNESSSPQNAATSTLQACAPQTFCDHTNGVKSLARLERQRKFPYGYLSN
jgi:hypothetical protein